MSKRWYEQTGEKLANGRRIDVEYFLANNNRLAVRG